MYAVQKGRVNARDVLLRIFKGLIDFRERNSSLALSRPVALTVGQIVDKVEQHYGSGLSGVRPDFQCWRSTPYLKSLSLK